MNEQPNHVVIALLRSGVSEERRRYLGLRNQSAALCRDAATRSAFHLEKSFPSGCI